MNTHLLTLIKQATRKLEVLHAVPEHDLDVAESILDTLYGYGDAQGLLDCGWFQDALLALENAYNWQCIKPEPGEHYVDSIVI